VGPAPLTEATHLAAALTLLAAMSDLSRFAPEIIAAVVAFVALSVVTAYVRQLNQRHARLLMHLETELAERRKAEDALRASERFYHSLVESLPAAILRKDMNGQFTFGNQKFYAALEVHQRDQLVGKTDLDFFPKALAEKYRGDDRRVIETGHVFETVEEHITPHGEKIFVQVIKTPLTDPEGKIIGVQGIFWDVTERKRAEEKLVEQNALLQEMARSEREAHAALKQAQSELVQQEKLASLGQIVAGVAHEINNPVAFVTNNVAVLNRDVGELRDVVVMYQEAEDLISRDRPELAARIKEFRDKVDMPYTLANIEGLISRSRDGLKRIQQIVSHLRLFAHLDEGDVNEADLNDGVESTAAIIVGHARKKSIKLEMDLTPLPPVTCNAAKINQVVMNLLTNAIDASPEGGTVTVRSKPEEGGVRIEVCDNGGGVEPEVRDRIFDPFFTTKPIGQGTGLGLSISYGIIKDHGGTIEVDSAAGQGACFIVHLPLRPSAKPSQRGGDPRDEAVSPEPLADVPL
jgi:two-component system, NtrC family, sensor kinase